MIGLASALALAWPRHGFAQAAAQRVPLPHDLSPWGMFLATDMVVKAVMIGLAVASVLVWTVWLAKTIELIAAKAALRRSRALLAMQPALGEARSALTDQRGVAGQCLAAAENELALSSGLPDTFGIERRVASRISDIEASAVRSIRAGTGLIATVGATAPFVGLFGTFWGIMNSFVGISKAQTTNLAVVAPGIAEALLATAIGLVAAIPAVILYNQLARAMIGYKALVRENASEVLRLVSRDLDRAIKSAPERLAQAAE